MDSSSEHSDRESSDDQSDEEDGIDGEDRGRRCRRHFRQGCIGRGKGIGRRRGAGVHGSSRGRSRGRRARGRCVRGAGRVRGSTQAGESMTKRQKKVLLGDWKHEESNALYFPFAGPPPGPVTAVTEGILPPRCGA